MLWFLGAVAAVWLLAIVASWGWLTGKEPKGGFKQDDYYR